MSRNRPPPITNQTIGQVPKGRIGVYAGTIKGEPVLRGHVGARATEVTARRFGSYGAKLVKVRGRDAWAGKTLAEISAKGPAISLSRKGATNARIPMKS